jgi:hypothetical protein
MGAKHLEVETYRLYFRPDSAGSWVFPGNFIRNSVTVM